MRVWLDAEAPKRYSRAINTMAGYGVLSGLWMPHPSRRTNWTVLRTSPYFVPQLTYNGPCIGRSGPPLLLAAVLRAVEPHPQAMIPRAATRRPKGTFGSLGAKPGVPGFRGQLQAKTEPMQVHLWDRVVSAPRADMYGVCTGRKSVLACLCTEYSVVRTRRSARERQLGPDAGISMTPRTSLRTRPKHKNKARGGGPSHPVTADG